MKAGRLESIEVRKSTFKAYCTLFANRFDSFSAPHTYVLVLIFNQCVRPEVRLFVRSTGTESLPQNFFTEGCRCFTLRFSAVCSWACNIFITLKFAMSWAFPKSLTNNLSLNNLKGEGLKSNVSGLLLCSEWYQSDIFPLGDIGGN